MAFASGMRAKQDVVHAPLGPHKQSTHPLHEKSIASQYIIYTQMAQKR